MIKLENWSVTNGSLDPYSPPEHCICLQGDVTGHPRLPDCFCTTSPIVGVNGREVTTYSGGVYVLGEPDPKYVQFCKDLGRHVPTEEEPIKVIKIK
jgi:hypothetical protein